MREFSTPLPHEHVSSGNLTDPVLLNAAEEPDKVVFSRRSGESWVDISAAEFLADVSAAARGLMAAGIQPGDRIALLSSTRYEWTVCDYAIWFAGGVTVPIYETSSVEQVAHILADSGASAVIVEDHQHRNRVNECRGTLPQLHHLWCLDDDGLSELGELGNSVTAQELETRRKVAQFDSLATLIYTSGTTGAPKGCEITHGNFLVELEVAVQELHPLFDPEDAATLLFLPLAHVFARIIQIGCVQARVRLGHASDIKQLASALAEFQPTFLLAVPRVFEKVFNTASQRATADGKGAIFNRAADVAIAWSRGLDKGGAGVLVRAQHALFNTLIYSKLRAALGGRCQYAVSGGAPLGERLGHFYRGIGVTILEGYGLTETAGAVTVNTCEAIKVGTVGRPLPGTTVRVADDGELLFRGPSVFRGYWNQPDTSAAALDEHGWFHTGDVGEVDDEGFVRITGRKKEILVTAGGKNVAPAVLEDRLRAHVLVDQCMVVGDGQPFIAALITLDQEALDDWKTAHNKTGALRELVEDPDLLSAIESAVADANKAVSKAESIRKFTVLPTEWSEEHGQLTPSLKLKRNVVMREFRDDVDALYLP